MIEAAGLSKKGLRQENQDSLLINHYKKLFIVADGMGGHNAGQLASTIAIKSAERFFENNYNKYPDKAQLVVQSMSAANKAVFEHTSLYPETLGMGTTMTFMHMDDDGVAYIGHVGDSRAYLINVNGISQLTDDHSYVGELLRNGGITEEDALNHPQRNLLMRAIGCAPQVDIDVVTHEVHMGDIILLCTDGLFNMVSNDEISHIVLENPVKDAVDILVDSALKSGGSDNVTVVLVKK
ncbi:Stp1/IreP family PP2C-type Ser/Thr phosphatase [Desulfitibacter alkalitolerans]|uniref:Stp1/IreP family PP2C-type Ser/Thr phosphatase n=1 Tax=Desulfitibacter alkalitolerans TaxID=264641 RepID=UPI0004894A41|nr:Stp1/IreP family PP2C-type Ser/Thr phosphatase [Desulfitibacter alkalitolerans]